MPQSKAFDMLTGSQVDKSHTSDAFSFLTSNEPEGKTLLDRAKDVEAKALDLVPQPVKTTVGTVLDYLARPSHAVAGVMKSGLNRSPEHPMDWSSVTDNLTGKKQDTFADVLASPRVGMEDSFTRHALGFVGDVVMDPLNLIGVGGVKAGAKAIGLTKGLESAGKLVAKLPGAEAAGKVVDALGDKFIPRYGMKLKPEDMDTLNAIGRNIADPEAARSGMRMFEKERSTIPARVEQDVIKTYQGTTPEFRKDVQLALDEGAGKVQHGHGQGYSAQDVDNYMLEQRRVNDDLFNREVASGSQKPVSYNPDYAHVDYSRAHGQKATAYTNPQSALSARNRNAIARKDIDKTMAEHIQDGAEPDVALAQLTRQITGERSVATGQYLQDTAKQFGLTTAHAPANWVTLKNLRAESPLAKQLKDIAFPSYIAKQLERHLDPIKDASELGKIYDRSIGLWRAQATVLRPGFHATNAQGNVFNGMYLAGVSNPMRMLEAATWGKIKTSAGAATQKIGNYTVKEIEDFMNKFGVGGAGHNFTNELLEQGADKVLLDKLGGKGANSYNPLTHPIQVVKHPIRAGKYVGGEIEDFSKRVLFFDALHKGETLEAAAKKVDKYLFDYSDLTQFEKKFARRVIPFYTWMRKNVPLQVGELANQPGKFSAIGKLTTDIDKVSKEEGTYVPAADRSKFLQEQNAIQVPTKKRQDRVFYTPYLPYQDLNKVPMPGGSHSLDVLRDIGGSLEPVTKALTELGLNKSFFYNKPVYDERFGPAGITQDRQKITDFMALLPESVKQRLFSETIGPGGKPQFETPALTRYLAQQLPLTESVGKAAKSITSPEEVGNPYAYSGQLTGVRLSNRTEEQTQKDKKAAIDEARTKRKLEVKQDRKPIKKEKAVSLYEKYLGQAKSK